ncbi:MAG TPA: 1-acyl-sn-glycerol-3-phosphate acyltransferase [Nostocaceae cyanobacterium]|nr:1-acyl-sn-glycerol-3-phosphate acyltransferase [Nostocaceae cyanobacterium]
MMDFDTASTTNELTPMDAPVNPSVADITSHVSPWLIPLAYFLGRYLVLPLFFGQIEIVGQENLPKSGAVILAPTHRARWDSLLLPYATGRCVTSRDLHFMVTMSECQGLQGWFVRRMGGFPVNQQRPAIATLRYAVELLQQRQMLVIYPEGGIFRDREIHPLKPGIARLALSAESSHSGLGVQIVPVSIHYSQPYPQWGTKVKINIGKPIIVTNYLNGCLKRDAQLLTTDLTYQLQQLNQQESVGGQLSVVGCQLLTND